MRNIEIFKWRPNNLANMVVAIIAWRTNEQGEDVDNLYFELETIGM